MPAPTHIPREARRPVDEAPDGTSWAAYFCELECGHIRQGHIPVGWTAVCTTCLLNSFSIDTFWVPVAPTASNPDPAPIPRPRDTKDSP